MELKKKSIRINSIRRAASKIPGVPGNLLINGQWFSSREWRNMLVGAGLNPNMTLVAFTGATLNYDEANVTQELLDANAGEVKVMASGREITFKKPGVNNLNLNVDFATVDVKEGTLNLAKLSNLYPDTRSTRTAPATPQVAEQIIEEDIAQENGQQVEHEQLAEQPATP